MDGTGVHKGLDPGAMCVVLLTQANGSDTPGLALAPSPSRPLGAGRRRGELHTHPTPHPPTPPPSLLSVLRTGVWVRVRGVRFAWRSFPNGLYQKKAKIDLGVSLLGKIGEVHVFLFRPSPGPGRAGDR